ncbi:MAG: tetratricopeptide repeat protein, partial [Phycisphaeraceae bacterium]|nr:tetratricopeptide repeat protein [Phycisphaeraceae bacterium]
EGPLFAQLAFVVGENHFRLGQWTDAIEPLEAFVGTYVKKPEKKKGRVQYKKAPNTDTALMQLGVAYARTGQRQKAINRLSLLISHHDARRTPHMPLALSELGKLHHDAGDYKKARAVLERFVRERKDKKNKHFHAADSQVGRVHYYLGWVEASENRHKEAAEHFKIAAERGGSLRGKDGKRLQADAVLQQGIALVNAEAYEKAAEHFRNVARRYKDHPSRDLVTYYSGLAYARVKNWRRAAEHFKRVVEDHPKAPFADKALYEWAWCERQQKRKKQAAERYEQLIEQYPKSELLTKVQSELAELNLDAGAQDAVIAKLNKTLETVTDPKLRFELRYQLASAHFKKKDFENSAMMFEALIPESEKSSLRPSILFQAGESRLMLTETVPARDHYLAAYRLKKGVPKPLAESILMRLAETQNLTGQHAEAEKNYRKFLQHHRESRWIRNARYGMAYAMEKQQNYKKAIGEYMQLLPRDNQKKQKVDLWMVKARYQIGECYFNLREYDKAMAEFVSVDANYRRYPQWQAKAVLEMGRVLLAQNKKEDAEGRMKEVIKRFPKTKAAQVATKYLDELRLGR